MSKHWYVNERDEEDVQLELGASGKLCVRCPESSAKGRATGRGGDYPALTRHLGSTTARSSPAPTNCTSYRRFAAFVGLQDRIRVVF